MSNVSSAEVGSDVAPDTTIVTRRAYILIGLALLCVTACLNLWYVTHTSLDLAGDEAHYWEWSRRLDWSYYSKGPLIAYIIAAGRSIVGGWTSDVVFRDVLAVRLPAVVLAALTGLGIMVLAKRVFRNDAIALLALALTPTVPILGIGSTILTTDSPLVCLWTWSLVLFLGALRRGSTVYWLAGGCLVALGILAKYTMVLIFPAVGLVLLFHPRARKQLAKPGPYVGLLVGLIGFVPIVIWNMKHGWVSLRHVGGQSGLEGGSGLDPLGPVTYALEQAAAFNPVWFVLLIMALWTAFQKIRQHTEAQSVESDTADTVDLLLLVSATLTVWAGFLIFSCVTRIQMNWPVPAVVSGVCLLAAWLREVVRFGGKKLRRRVLVASPIAAALGLAMLIIARNTTPLMPLFAWLARSSPPWELTPVAKFDPSSRLRGWSQLGREISEVLKEQRALGLDPMVVTDYYQTASAIAFYARDADTPEPEVYCLQSALGGRLNQYDLWENPISSSERFSGRRSIYVGSLRYPEIAPKTEGEIGALGELTLLRTVEHRVGGYLIRTWPVVLGRAFRGFNESALRNRPRKF